MIRRREFIAGLGGAATLTAAAWAQQPAMPVIGVLSSVGPYDAPTLFAAFHKGLGEAGYFEKKNIEIEYRWAENRNDRLPALARDLVEHHVAAIAVFGGPAPSLAAKAATSAIPIVFRLGADPVKLGLVASLNKPGGNMTGVSSLSEETGSKRFELIHQMVPSAASVVALVNPASLQREARTQEWGKAARALGIHLLVLNASSAREIEEAFATMAQQNIEALVAAQDPFYFAQRHQLVALAARYRIPAIYHVREAVEAGGLMSYGPSIADGYHLAGIYLGRILKGEKPADLPVQQSTRFEMVVNRKTAKALGLDVPQTLLVAADEVID
jgi:putative tryptophan/tyrosine transport system substrate-binding protein